MNSRRRGVPKAAAKTIQDSLSKDGFHRLSELRRAEIQDAETRRELDEDREGGSRYAAVSHSSAYRSVLNKKAMSGPATLPTTSGLSDMLGPEVYSPLFQLANLNLPRDRVTMNAWNRIFYDTHPIVRNAINLHASYPISKINITHPVKKVQDYFLEMSEQLDLYSVVYGASLEFWKMGEVFPYAELDKETGSWKRITILNPDYVHVKKAAIGDHTIVSLKPDAALHKLVNSNSPTDLKLKRRLPKHIINAVKKGQSIPLDNINVSHLKLLSSPYDIRGTSVIVSTYKDLMLYDKLRESKFAQADGMVNPLTLVKLGGNDYRPTQADIEAMRIVLEEAQYDKDFKIVTHDGVTIERVGFNGGVMDISSDLELIMNNLYTGLMVPKALMDQEGACLSVDDNEVLEETKGWISYDQIGNDDKIATVEPNTGELIFHKPTFKKDFEFTGMMFGFKNQEVDVETTDFHEMLLSRDNGLTFSKERALSIFNSEDIGIDKVSSRDSRNVRFKTSIDSWKGSIPNQIIKIPYTEQYTKKESFKEIPLDDWLKLAGYYLSEGHLRRRNDQSRKNTFMKPMGIDVTQQVDGKGFEKMSSLFDRLPYNINITGSNSGRRTWNIMNQNLSIHFLSEFGEKSSGKKVPSWMKNLPQRELSILLEALILGDGHVLKNSTSGTSYYSTISRQLADDVQEIAFKCGYTTKSRWESRKGNRRPICKVAIFKNKDSKKGPKRKNMPIVKPSDTSIRWVNNHRVFCVEVPNHVFVTRSNGKIGIHGNTYASSSIGLEVLRQRYDIFRNMIKKWLEQKIFAPICEMQDFFEYKNGEKTLLVPTVDFNHMNLYDMNDYIQGVSGFVTNKQVSLQTLYRSLGLSYDEEKRRLREEAIDEVIKTKELESLQSMRLRELENLDVDGVIPEPPDSGAGGLPGMPGEGEDGGMGLDLPGMGGGGGAPPMPGAGAPGGEMGLEAPPGPPEGAEPGGGATAPPPAEGI